MKRMIVTVSLVAGFCFAAASAQAGWGVCNGCHNGTMAINKGEMLAKYTTVEELIKGAQATENPMMANIKQDVDGLKAAAAELGLKSEKEAQ